MANVRTQDDGVVRHVVLTRPEKRNAMNGELLEELGEALADAGGDPTVQAIVLRGEGPVFSAGVDLGDLGQSAANIPMLRSFRDVFLRCANLCEAVTKPVVCQIHGACFGGALEVALGCDLRGATPEAKLGLPEVRFGIIPDVGGSTRLPAVVGVGRAKDLIMTGRTIDAVEGERIGLINRVAEPDDLDGAVEELVGELLSGSNLAVGRAKHVIDAVARPTITQSLEMEIATQEFLVQAAAAAAAAAQEG